MFPADEDIPLASVDWSEVATLTIPDRRFAILNTANWYMIRDLLLGS